MKKIKKIGPQSSAKLFGVLYVFLGLIGGIMFFLISVFSGRDAVLFGVLALIGIPVGYGVMGFITGYFTAFFYNLIAKKVGGIEVELE